MNVRDLVESLSHFPPETPVIVEGYEAGYEDVVHVRLVQVLMNVHTEPWYGPHDVPDMLTEETAKASEGSPLVGAVLVGGKDAVVP